MRAEDLPPSDAESVKDGSPLLRAQLDIRVNGGHENGGVLVVFCLLRREAVDIYIEIIPKGRLSLGVLRVPFDIVNNV